MLNGVDNLSVEAQFDILINLTGTHAPVVHTPYLNSMIKTTTLRLKCSEVSGVGMSVTVNALVLFRSKNNSLEK